MTKYEYHYQHGTGFRCSRENCYERYFNEYGSRGEKPPLTFEEWLVQDMNTMCHLLSSPIIPKEGIRGICNQRAASVSTDINDVTCPECKELYEQRRLEN